MANFYITATIADVPQARIADEIGAIETFIGPTQGRFTVVYPEIMQLANPKFRNLWAKLSRSLDTSILVTSVYDDDVFHYELWQNGELSDQYVSDPSALADDELDDDYADDWQDDAEPVSGPEGGNAARLCLTYQCNEPQRVAEILSAPRTGERYLFETARHADLAQALGLPATSVGDGFHYIAAGELPVGVAAAQLIRLPRA